MLFRSSVFALGVTVLAASLLYASGGSVSGHVTDPEGRAVPHARILVRALQANAALQAETDSEGRFFLGALAAGNYRVIAESAGFSPLAQNLNLADGQNAALDFSFPRPAPQRQAITIHGDLNEADVFFPDPGQRVTVRQDSLDANPGRPGVPISLPGLPAESASGGIKAPQYFAPGVAGDHGEPIAQFIAVGGFLLPNNLPANAHGNGYADPNLLIAPVIESVQVDGGAFNVREGNNAIDLAATFGLRTRLEPFLRFTGDAHDFDAVAGWSPGRAESLSWIAVEFTFGNGYLRSPEHRHQYKVNASRIFTSKRQRITVLGIGYFGESRIPGLTPVDVRAAGDTIDSRQSDRTYTGLAAVNDVWQLDASRQFQLSAFARSYSLDLRSNFGDGLIRQSESRLVAGGNATYAERWGSRLALLAGGEFRREAPRGLDLQRADNAGAFQPVTGNDLTITFASPFASLDGRLTSFLHFNIGMRRDQVYFTNDDLLTPAHSFRASQAVNSPKATLALLPPESLFLPAVAFSYGQAFHTNDPRIGVGEQQGTIVSKSRAAQLVVSKFIAGTDLRVTLVRVSNAQELAKLSADTGLQQDIGPSLIHAVTFSAKRTFGFGSLQVSYARADAHDRQTGEPIPEAPRLIGDALGTFDRLPFHLQARGEFEYVGRKPLGDGFEAVPVKEIRGSLLRPFLQGRMDAGINFLLARGYTGQTLETLSLAGEQNAFERPVGVRLASYVTLSCTYRFGRANRP